MWWSIRWRWTLLRLNLNRICLDKHCDHSKHTHDADLLVWLVDRWSLPRTTPTGSNENKLWNRVTGSTDWFHCVNTHTHTPPSNTAAPAASENKLNCSLDRSKLTNQWCPPTRFILSCLVLPAAAAGPALSEGFHCLKLPLTDSFSLYIRTIYKTTASVWGCWGPFSVSNSYENANNYPHICLFTLILW